MIQIIYLINIYIYMYLITDSKESEITIYCSTWWAYTLKSSWDESCESVISSINLSFHMILLMQASPEIT